MVIVDKLVIINTISKRIKAFHGNLYKRFTFELNPTCAPIFLNSSRLITCAASDHHKFKPDFPNTISIYRVPNNMRQVETKAYDPKIVSIGPYHHGAERLQAMEDVKMKYLARILDPIQDHGITFGTLFDAIKSLEAKSRGSYSDTIDLGSDEFVETMVIDGCFILELFRSSVKIQRTRDCDDLVFQTRWMLPVLRRDLIMLENQIPMFVLLLLFNLTRSSGYPESTSSLIDLALKFFNPLMPRDQETLNRSIAMVEGLGVGGEKSKHLLHLFRKSLLPPNDCTSMVRGRQPLMFRSIKELQEAGIKLEKRENCSALDVRFDNGVLKIPSLLMDDYTGTLFRNIVAFEQSYPACKPDFTSYLFFIDGLVNTSDDIVLLHYAGIIQHSLGSDAELADLFNKLCREVSRDGDESYLHLVSSDLNEYCNKNWNKWRAELVHNYFSSPWALISMVSAILFFVLAVIQTYMDYVMFRRKFIGSLEKK